MECFKKTVMVLPGTLWQVELVKKIKEMGHRVIVVNPASDSPCFEYADEYLQSDIFAREKVIEFGKKNHVDAVLSDECDIVMNWLSELGEILNVPTIDKCTALLYTDKFLMREFCKKKRLKNPEYRLCKNVEDAVCFLKEIQKKIVIKPIDSNASHGVFCCMSEDDIRKQFEKTLSFSRNNKSVLAERYINGVEFTVDGLKTPFSHYTLAISEKKHYKHNPNIAKELLFSHDNPKYDYDVIRKLNDSFVMASNLQYGFTHAEYKYEDGNYYLIEIAARGGGNMISSCITQYMTGYDTYRYLVECALGNALDQDFSLRPEYRKRVAVLSFFTPPNGGGKVVSIEGLDYLREEPDIKFFRLNFNEGDTIKDALNDSSRIGFFIACSENIKQLQNVIQNVEETFKIRY